MQSLSKPSENSSFEAWAIIYYLLQCNEALEQARQQEAKAYLADYRNEVRYNYQLQQELEEAYCTIEYLEGKLNL